MTEMFSLQLAVGAVASAILHSLWQGALIGVLTALSLWVLRGGAAGVRYAVACLGLAALAMAWLMTAINYANQPDVNAAAVLTTSNGSQSPNPAPQGASPLVVPFTVPASETPIAPWVERLEAWSRAAVPLWFAGVLVLSIRLAFGWRDVRRIRRASNEPLTGRWTERVTSLTERLRISTPVRVAQSAMVQVPTLIGWVRPVILIPASVVSGLTTAQLEAVIAHELAHVRRHDYVANIVQTAAEILLFYHPACWWISKQIRAEREHCCDDIAVSVCGDGVLYAEALANLETLRSGPQPFSLAATDGVLMRRVRRLVAAAPAETNWWPTWAAAAVPLTAVAILTLSTTTPAQSISSDEGIVQGQVVDARSGRPVPGATVEISGGDRSQQALTTDEGRYEVRGLAPGEYNVRVQARRYIAAEYGQRYANERASMLDVRGGRYTTGINVRLEPAGVVTGRVFDDRGEGLAGVEVELLADRIMPDGIRPVGVGFAQTEAGGAYRFDDVRPGDYYVRAYASPSVRPSRGASGQVYGSTFYPGVTRSELGQRLRLSSGQELFGVDFTLATMPTRRVSGVVVDPAGALRPRTRVHLRAVSHNSTDVQYDGNVESNGRFEVANVVPGNYLISVIEPGSMTARWMRTTRSLSVDDDVVDLELRARLGARVEGRVVRDAFVTRSLDPTGVSVTFAYRLSGDGSSGFGWGGIIARGRDGALRIGPDGAFSTESPGGMSVIRVSELPPNWTVKAVRLEGTDITDQEIDFGEGVRQVEVVLTDRVSQVRGSVVERTGRPLAGGSVIVFVDNSALWGESSRHVRETRSGRDGQFQVTGLPPAEYLAVAIENLPALAWMNPDVLNRLRPLATRFRLDEGGERVVNLRPSPAPDGLIPAY
jgi:beta-lactamase regulating signal transducer with metallopeptidase domain